MVQVGLEDEILAIRQLCLGQWKAGQKLTLTATKDQWGAVRGMFNAAMEDGGEDREARLATISKLTGRVILSFKLLTDHECRTLIDALSDPTFADEDGNRKVRVSEHGRRVIQYAEYWTEPEDDRGTDQRDGGEHQTKPEDDFRNQRGIIGQRADKPSSVPQRPENVAVPKAERARAWADLSDMW